MIKIIDLYNSQGVQSEEHVIIDGVEYVGWVESKPINPRRLGTRIRGAWLLLRGKAIAVQYFDDLTEKQKVSFIKQYWQKASEIENK